MSIRPIAVVVLIAFSLCYNACNPVPVSQAELLPQSSSDVDEIMLVMDDRDFEEGIIRDFINTSLLEDFPMLPQGEPRFNVHQVPPVDLMPLLRQASTIVYFADLSRSEGTAAVVQKQIVKAGVDGQNLPFFVRKNVWAKPQNVIYFYGDNQADLRAKLDKNREKLLSVIYDLEDKKAYNNAYVSGVNEGYSEEIKSKFGIDMDIPLSFRKVGLPEDSPIMWYREDQTEKVSNLLVTAVDYDKLPTRSLDKLSDQLHEKYGAIVQSETEGSRMSRDTVHFETQHLPLDIDGHKSNLSRGIWIMTKEFMGGPYINLVIDQPEKNRVLFLEGFIYAPSDKKRKLIRRVEQMLLNVEV